MSENYGHPKKDQEYFLRKKGEKKWKHIDQIYINQLIPHKEYPFPLYTGKRLIDLGKDMIANGFGEPIIARSINIPQNYDINKNYVVLSNNMYKYEVLTGYNRVMAAKEAGFVSVPVIYWTDLTDEEALQILNENIPDKNFFKYMKPSERADALAFYYDEIKKSSGYRSDLKEKKENQTCASLGRRSNKQNKTDNQDNIIETHDLLKKTDNPTCAPQRRRLDTREIIAHEYDICKTEVARLLRIHKLIPALKNRLDNDEIGMRVAEALSYLKNAEQEMVEEILTSGTKINIKQADKLKEKSKQGEVSKASIMKILEIVA